MGVWGFIMFLDGVSKVINVAGLVLSCCFLWGCFFGWLGVGGGGRGSGEMPKDSISCHGDPMPDASAVAYLELHGS